MRGQKIWHILIILSLTACGHSCYRHTDEMIGKLESAGLGFYVKATETQQKLGKQLKGKLMYSTMFVL